MCLIVSTIVVLLIVIGVGIGVTVYVSNHPYQLDNIKNKFNNTNNDNSSPHFGSLFLTEPSDIKEDINQWPTNSSTGGSGDDGGGLYLTILNALDPKWDKYFYTAIGQWDNGKPDTMSLYTSSRIEPDMNCTNERGYMKVCNGDYGNTMWVGATSVLRNSSNNTHYIKSASARMNEYYIFQGSNTSKPPLYGTNETILQYHRQYVMCHEIGHALGLPHNDLDFFNKDTGNCLDITNQPFNNMQPSYDNFKILQKLYGKVSSNYDDIYTATGSISSSTSSSDTTTTAPTTTNNTKTNQTGTNTSISTVTTGNSTMNSNNTTVGNSTTTTSNNSSTTGNTNFGNNVTNPNSTSINNNTGISSIYGNTTINGNGTFFNDNNTKTGNTTATTVVTTNSTGSYWNSTNFGNLVFGNNANAGNGTLLNNIKGNGISWNNITITANNTFDSNYTNSSVVNNESTVGITNNNSLNRQLLHDSVADAVENNSMNIERQRKQKYLSSSSSKHSHDKVVDAPVQPLPDWINDAINEINTNFIYVTHEKRQHYRRKLQQQQQKNQQRMLLRSSRSNDKVDIISSSSSTQQHQQRSLFVQNHRVLHESSYLEHHEFDIGNDHSIQVQFLMSYMEEETR